MGTIVQPAEVKDRPIPFFNYRGAFAAREEEFVGIFRGILRRGAFIQQAELETFERHLAAYVGVKHAFGVGNATDGLIIAWLAAGLRPGDEVIVPSHTMVATAAAVHHAGGVPVLVDCGPDHLIDPDAAAAAITPRTRAICPVQLNGRTAEMDRIQRMAEEHGLFIIEDSAQALGSRFDGRCAGTFGRAGVFSFYPAKILGCVGDGGAIVTDDDELARRIALLRDHGRDEHGDVRLWGFNSRLDNLQAALLDAQFAEYAAIVAHRRAVAGWYHAALADVEELVLPPAPDADARHFDVYQNFEVEAEDRNGLRAHLAQHGIGTIVQWGGKPVHQQPGLGFTAALPATDRLFERCLMLPMNLMVERDDVSHIAARIREYYGR